MRNYVTAVIAAAIICAVCRSLTDEKTSVGQFIKLLTGILMTVTLVSPVLNVSFQNVSTYLEALNINADSYVAQGTSVAGESMNAIIKQQTEAYILDKANRMGVQISVEVELSEDNDSIPCGVTVKGAAAPYAKEIISSYIEDTLGITRENQKWI